MQKRVQNHFRGCMLGGAIGDALGNPVEFLQYEQIQRRYGKAGIEDLVLNASGEAEITDDTQMSLFTAEGLLRAFTRFNQKGIWHPSSVVFYAYQRWLVTQGYPKVEAYARIYDGWLMSCEKLFACRAPGNTCLSALLSHKQGSIEEPLNNSNGCGGVMRVAPVGLLFDKQHAFKMSAEVAALTHGHPSGYLSAGVLGLLICLLIEGMDLFPAIQQTIEELITYKGHEECLTCLTESIDLSEKALNDYEAISQIGHGWVGEEALAIAIYCALKYQGNFRKALIASVNHDGDSDSTGAITGNILGAALGIQAIPDNWVRQVELREVLTEIADDLLKKFEDTEEWWQRYPG